MIFVVEKTYPRINSSVGKIKLLLMFTAVYKYFTITKYFIKLHNCVEAVLILRADPVFSTVSHSWQPVH